MTDFGAPCCAPAWLPRQSCGCCKSTSGSSTAAIGTANSTRPRLSARRARACPLPFSRPSTATLPERRGCGWGGGVPWSRSGGVLACSGLGDVSEWNLNLEGDRLSLDSLETLETLETEKCSTNSWINACASHAVSCITFRTGTANRRPTNQPLPEGEAPLATAKISEQ